MNAEKLTRREQTIKELFVGTCWKYLNDNFHKFNQANQIKIALELCKKDIPQEHTGEIRYVQMSVIKVEDKPLGLDLGDDIPQVIRDRMT